MAECDDGGGGVVWGSMGRRVERIVFVEMDVIIYLPVGGWRTHR